MYFCIKNYIGTQGEVCRQLKIFSNPPHRPPPPPPIGRSKAMAVLKRWSRCYSVWLCGLYYGALHDLVFPCSLSSCFVIPFSIVITWLGEEGAGLCASRAFVCCCCCLRVSFCHLSLPLGVRDWLRFVIVALPGLFYSLFYVYIQPIIKNLWSDFQRYVTIEHRDVFFFFFLFFFAIFRGFTDLYIRN